uniref:FecR family protein n=1 Tax=Pedobacter schmidteae TaxID=2201271 RepID=UPI000EB3358A|nr:FecR family protein [Pedobacter schmidteae]
MSEQEKELLIRYNAGQCTDAEKAAVEKWLFELNNGDADLPEENLIEIKEEIRSKLPVPAKTRFRKRVLWWPRIAASIALIAVGISLFYFVNRQHTKSDLISTVHTNGITPGKNSATLTLADGKKIILSDVHSGELANESGVMISKTADQQIVYNVIDQKGVKNDKNASGNSEVTTYNTLSTAKGETFQVRLPDGSLVILNAASSLTYSTGLNKQAKRSVKLSGEAYFEVSKLAMNRKVPGNESQRKPFIVVTGQQEVEVLGTHFNINSYSDEAAVKTTLLEGSVRVSNHSAEKILKPGQQSISKADGFVVKDVNIQQVVAWKNGTFDFDNEDILSVMRKISRWYNVDIVFEGPVTRERFNGALSRHKNIIQMLKMLESTGVVHFKIEGRRVVVINN